MIHVNAGGYLKLGQVIATLGTKEARAAVRRSLTRTITTVAAQSAREIRQRKLVKLSAAEIKRGFTFKNQTRGGIGEMYASMEVSGRAISLAKYWARKVRPPKGQQRVRKFKHLAAVVPLYAAQVRVFGKTYIAGKGFIVNYNGGAVIFERDGAARKPINKMWGPSLADAFNKTDLKDKIQELASRRFNETLTAEMNYRIGKLSSGKPLR